MCEDIRTNNRCYKECPLWDDEAACGKVQPERNCYQCPIASEPGLKKNLDAWREAAMKKFGLKDLLDLCKVERVSVTVTANSPEDVRVRVMQGSWGVDEVITREELERVCDSEKHYVDLVVRKLK